MLSVILITSSSMLCFNLCLFVGWFVSSTTQQLLYVFPLSLDNWWVSAHAEADEMTVSRIFSHILTLCDKAFFNIFSNLSGKNAWILIKKHLDYLLKPWVINDVMMVSKMGSFRNSLYPYTEDQPFFFFSFFFVKSQWQVPLTWKCD